MAVPRAGTGHQGRDRTRLSSVLPAAGNRVLSDTQSGLRVPADAWSSPTEMAPASDLDVMDAGAGASCKPGPQSGAW